MHQLRVVHANVVLTPPQVSDQLGGYLLPSALRAGAISENQHLPWSCGGTLSYPTHVDSLCAAVSHAQYQQPAYPSGLPSPALTVPETTPPPGQLRHVVLPASCPWSPISPISLPVADSAARGSFPDHPDAMLLPDSAAPSLPTSHPGAIPDWTGTIPQFDPMYLGFVASNLALSGVPTDFCSSLPAEPIPTAAQPDVALLGSIEPASGGYAPQETALQPSHPEPTANPIRKGAKERARRARGGRRALFRPKTAGEERSSLTPSSAEATSPGLSLRTATRRFRRAETTPKPDESPEHRRARTTHNMVEQEYRRRLTTSFQQLLDSLPGDILADEDADETSPGTRRGKRQRMSKADVLTRTVRIIKFLESDIEGIKREVGQMKEQLQKPAGGLQLDETLPET
ncbi:Allergen Fus c 3 [Madurella mycetomatis]|uniref:Allergen Fus c 3 n=1 Tax=Madurella mycetomatis TaxID=100816 RepID=A0A175VPB1_9PEZI|nr:Allergen Fus c 3 [Madurella mycetomatis]